MLRGNGVLYLMPVWLGELGGTEQLPPENIAIAGRVDLWFAEHEKTARLMLRRMLPEIDLQRQEIHRFDKDGTTADAEALLRLMQGGRDAAVISEAGMPGIADPGALLVRAAHRIGIRVVPLTGPSSMMLALAASGLNGQRFTFHGYLPRTPQERKQAIRKIEADALRSGGAELFMETPYRNEALFAELLQSLRPQTRLCIGANISHPDASIHTFDMATWKSHPPELKKIPAVYILGR